MKEIKLLKAASINDLVQKLDLKF